MPSKQDLEVQVETLKLEVEQLKSAQPADVVTLREENESLRASERKMALEAVTHVGEMQSALEQIEQLKKDLTDADVQASLAKEILKAEIDSLKKAGKSQLKGEQVTAAEVMLRLRTRHIHENQKCLILED